MSSKTVIKTAELINSFHSRSARFFILENIKQNILQAMSHWEKNTCIRFINQTDEKDYIIFNPGPCG